MKEILEPSIGDYNNVAKRYFFATRPAFLLATIAGCLLGLASARLGSVAFKPGLATLTILLALLVHAAVNVLNDYFDALSGADALNEERLYPFTGGSRFIQNGLFTASQMLLFGYLLLGLATLGGLWLVAQVGIGLLLIGVVGVFIGWAYSATPLQLNSRGLGELSVMLGFLGVIVGADFVQRSMFSWQPIVVGLTYGLLVTNLLFINQFPDYKADVQAGKRHWVVRLTPSKAVFIYPCMAAIAFAWLFLMVVKGNLPVLALMAGLPLFFSLQATRFLKQYYVVPAKLRPAIQCTLLAILSHAFILILVLFWNTR